MKNLRIRNEIVVLGLSNEGDEWFSEKLIQAVKKQLKTDEATIEQCIERFEDILHGTHDEGASLPLAVVFLTHGRVSNPRSRQSYLVSLKYDTHEYIAPVKHIVELCKQSNISCYFAYQCLKDLHFASDIDTEIDNYLQNKVVH